MAFGTKLLFEPMRSSAFGSVGASYTVIGTPFDNKIHIILANNSTDVGVILSFDGVNDHIFVPPFGNIVLDVATNKTNRIGLFISKYCSVYQKRANAGTAPTEGAVYISVGYASGE